VIVRLKHLTSEGLVTSGAFLLMLCALAGAEDAPVLRVSELVEEALANNPGLVGVQSQWEAAGARVSPAAVPPNPSLGLGYGMIPEDEFSFGNAGMRTLSVSQMIPFPGKLHSQYRAASHISAMAGQIYRAKRRELVARVKKVFYDLYALHESIRIMEENRDLLKTLSKIAETKYAVGRSAAGDLLKAQVELSKLENDLLTLRQKVTTEEARMNTLLNRPMHRPLGRPEAPSLDPVGLPFEELASIALVKRPQLIATQESSKAAGAQHAASKMDYFPDLMLTVKQQDMVSGTDTWEIMFSAELPLWSIFKENEKLEETRAKLEAARAAVQDATNETRLAVQSAYTDYDTARRTLELYETSVLPQAELSLESARVAYENDTRDFLSLLDSERSLLRFKLEYAKAQSDYEKSVAELEMTVGAELPRG
jgi:cobalt-zinc-cadmium efflux system outer membrane protein